MKQKSMSCSISSPLVGTAFFAFALASSATAQSRTYTSDADFDEGTLLNVNHNAPNSNQLQLGFASPAFSILSVACGGLGTVVRIDTETCEIAGEYLSSPEGMDRDPSRSTVDLLGNTWIGNRVEDGEGRDDFGSVAKFGIVIGGTRVNADGTPNPNGEYLAPPYEYNTCIDRDGDGLIRTSRGLGDVFAWPDLSDGLGGSDARVEDSIDEAVLIFQRTEPVRIRHISVDASNNVWAGGYPTFPTSFDYLDGTTGEILMNVDADPPGCGGYAGVVDGANVLWSTAEQQGEVFRYDGVNPATCIDVQANVRGITLAPDGDVWLAGGRRVSRLNPDGSVDLAPVLVSAASQLHGIAVHPNGSIWAASSGTGEVLRLDNDGILVQAITTGSQCRSVSIDRNGYVWVVNREADTVQRIDPATNLVDKTINLRPGSQAFNPSDMTGVVALNTSPPIGDWQVITDGAIEGVTWSNVAWNASLAEGSNIEVMVRAADTTADLSFAPWTPTGNATGIDLLGRFLEVSVSFERSDLNGISPVLFDLSVEGSSPNAPEDCIEISRRQAGSLLIFPEFDNETGSCTVLTLTNTDPGNFGTLAVEFVYIDGETCEETNRIEHLTPGDTFTVLTKSHNPNMERGFVYVFVKDGPGGSPIVANTLIGSVLVINGGISTSSAIEYGINALAFQGIGENGFTDVDGDGLRDLDGIEYGMAPASLLIPRFLGQRTEQGPGLSFHSSLILVSLSGGTQFTTTLDFLVYNDNEEVFSTEHSFYCWEKTDLLDISNVFGVDFLLDGTSHNPLEPLGTAVIET
ncbi:MAG: hypothetical protein ACI8X5_003010, partial [Planctomycetota bacterium]